MASDLQARVREVRRRRELAATQRAGRYARGQAWRMQLSFARRSWWLLAGIAVMVPVFCVPLGLTLHGGPRWALMGGAVATGVWLAVLYLVVHAGAAPKLMGAVAEESTTNDLASLGRKGWRTVNGVRLRVADIDHIAVGPPGVLVVETKWAAEPWTLELGSGSFMAKRLAGDLDQVRGNTRDVKNFTYFRKAIGAAPVRAVLVLRSSSLAPAEAPDWIDVDGVTVVSGEAFRRWLKTLEGDALDPRAFGACGTSCRLGRGSRMSKR